jgi:hypothetical protein
MTNTYLSNNLVFFTVLYLIKRRILFMNSLSNTNCNGTQNVTDTCPQRFAVCQAPIQDLHPLPFPAILECGQVNNRRITAVFPPAATPTVAPLDLASVEIDTTCLCFANLKLEFSTLIDSDATGAAGPLVLQLSRSCNGGTKAPLATYTLTLPVPGGTSTLPFNFVYCIENAPLKDCTYFVDITSADPGNGANAAIEFKNTAFAAFAVGASRHV